MALDYSAIVRQDLAAPARPWSGFPTYNFIGGHNDPEHVPVDDLVAAASAVIRREGRSLATYNLESGPLGYSRLRAFVAATLKSRAEIACSEDEVLITSGSLQSIDLVCDVLLAPGDTVIVEAVTYNGTLARLRRRGVGYVGVPTDDAGMRMDALSKTLAGLKADGVRPKFIYTIPTVQNPTGSVMTEARRREMLDLARQYGVVIFEDDCYADLLWDGARPPAIHALDAQSGGNQVVYCGSFSKSIAPALRLGYVVAGWDLMQHILPAKTDAGTGALAQMVLAEYGPAHFDSHVTALTATLHDKCRVMMEALEANFGTTAEFTAPKGGIFIWITLPEAVDTTALAAAAGAEGVTLNPGAEWTADPAIGQHSLRLCFGNPTMEQIRDGVAKLADICYRTTGVPERSANVERGGV